MAIEGTNHVPLSRSAASPSNLTAFVPTAATTPVARLSKPTDPASLLTALGLPAPEGSIYELALTHSSYRLRADGAGSAQRAPRVPRRRGPGLVITDMIFRARPEMAEGDLAKLGNPLSRAGARGARPMSGSGCSSSARQRRGGLGRTRKDLSAREHLRGTDRRRVHGPRLEFSKRFWSRCSARCVDDSVTSGSGEDAKTSLQEYVVRERGTRPSYRVASSGPDHDKRFDADVYINEELYGVGSGTSKKAAEQIAAREALDRLEREVVPPQATEEARPDARAS